MRRRYQPLLDRSLHIRGDISSNSRNVLAVSSLSFLHRLLLRQAGHALRVELPDTFALHELWKAIRRGSLRTVRPLCDEDTNNGCSGWQELICQGRAAAILNHLHRERPDASARNVAVHAWAGGAD